MTDSSTAVQMPAPLNRVPSGGSTGVDLASISEGEIQIFNKSVPNHLGQNVPAPDFRKDRQIALAHELLKPKYQAYGFRTSDLLNKLPEHFQNPAQIRYEMNKLRVRCVVSKVKNQSFYRVTETGWKCLPAMPHLANLHSPCIPPRNAVSSLGCLDSYGRRGFGSQFALSSISKTQFTRLNCSCAAHRREFNWVISRAMKNQPSRNAEQPSQIEAPYALLDQGLNLISQELAVIS